MENTDNINDRISQLAERVVKLFTEKGKRAATAESCTGGMISAAITAVSGSSAVIELGICSYSNRIKNEILGVNADTLEKLSEYSLSCAEEMASGVLRLSAADFAVSTTGIAGPGGGNENHPVGEVFIAVADRTGVHSERFVFHGGREDVRKQACCKALEMLISEIER